jgi:hypothetical protein
VQADEVQSLISQTLAGLEVKASGDPYSRTIEKILIGYDKQGNAKVGIALREIESFKPITGLVVVHKTADGFILHEAAFPDIGIISNAKDRKQVLDVLKNFKSVPFNPHAEKSAVDGVTGATRYGIKTYGYLNYMARKVALEMETNPDWPTQKAK